MQMKRLEERIGKAIFERDGRASKLTDDGDGCSTMPGASSS